MFSKNSSGKKIVFSIYMSPFILLSMLLCINGFFLLPKTSNQGVIINSSNYRFGKKKYDNRKKILGYLSDPNTKKNINEKETKDNQNETSIAIVGSGAVGCYYGARLWESNYDVRFLARGEQYETCIKHGLNVTSPDGDIFIPAMKINMYESVHEIGPVDWIIIAVKSTSLREMPPIVKPLLKKDSSTRILAIMNGLIDEDLASLIIDNVDSNKPSNSYPFSAIYGGMAFLCSNRIKPGNIVHSYAGRLSAGVSFSSSVDSNLDQCSSTNFIEDLAILEDLWKPTNVEFVPETSLILARWVKNLWNLPFNGISVAMGGITIDKICSDPDLRKLAESVMNETVSIACADIDSRGADSTIPDWEKYKEMMWYLSDNMGPYKTSTMLDLKERKPMEVRYLFHKPLERAKQLNVATPHLSIIVAEIQKLQKQQGL